MNEKKSSKPVMGAVALVVLIILGIGGWELWPAVVHAPSAVTATPPPPGAANPETAPADKPPVPPTKKSGVVYEADFEKGVGNEWSDTFTATTPEPVKAYLAPMGEDPFRFSIGDLPPHKFVEVKFDLLLNDRWNGDNQYFGRDLWDMRVVDGQPLIHTTFGNCGFWTNNNDQSFPDQYPWYPTHPAWTGAAARQSLGFMTSQGNDSYGCDSTYAFDLIFPHTSDKLALEFKSQIKNHDHKPYGFLTFKVTTIDHAAEADEKTLAGWWADLAGEDPVKAYQSAWSLIATGDTATTYVKGHLPPADTSDTAPPLNIDQTAKWASGCFQYTTPAARQRARAIHVLEVINTSAAKAVLEKIGYEGTPQGAPPDQWTK